MPESSAPSRHRTHALLMVAGAVAGLCVLTWRLIAPPLEPPQYTEARPHEVDAEYAGVTHSVFIQATPGQVWAWANDPSLRLEDLVRFEGFPAVVGTEPIIGEWAPGEREGDRRRVEFADGHFLAEEVLVDSPERFRYMIWGLTSPQRFIVQHAVAEFQYDAEGAGTRVTWEYTFLPTAGILRPAVASFLESTMSPMMRATLAAMRDGVEGSTP